MRRQTLDHRHNPRDLIRYRNTCRAGPCGFTADIQRIGSFSHLLLRMAQCLIRIQCTTAI